MNKKLLEFKREEITLTEAANRYGELVRGTWTFDTWAKGLEDEIKGMTFYTVLYITVQILENMYFRIKGAYNDRKEDLLHLDGRQGKA